MTTPVLLPLWVRTSPLWLFAPISFLFAWSSVRLAIAVAGPRADAQSHWTEQARRLWPRLSAAGFALLFALGGAWFTGGMVAAPHAFAGIPRTVRPLGARLREMFAGLMLRQLILVIYLIGLVELRPHPIVMLLFMVAGVLAFWFGATLPLSRWLGAARLASPRLRAVVERAALQTGVRPRAVYEAPMSMANAFALIGARSLIFTDGALALLDDTELELVCAHELGHLGESRRTSSMRLAGLLALPLVACAVTLIPSDGDWFSFLMRLYAALIAVIVVLFLLRRVTRRAEEQADVVAHGAQHDSGSYARALEKIYRANRAPAVIGKKGTHPDLYDRMISAGVQPDYPRPLPPSRRRLRFANVLSLALCSALLTVPYLLHARFRDGAPRRTRAALVALAGLGGDGFDLATVAYAAFAEHDLARSSALYLLAGERDAGSAAYPAMAARTLNLSGRCVEARAAAELAQSRLGRSSPKWERAEVQSSVDGIPNCIESAR